MAEKRCIKSQKHINKLLPAEMLERVFHLLPPRDLKAVVLVCRWWREVGEAPALWVWVMLQASWKNIQSMAEALGSRRLQGVRRLEVEDMAGRSNVEVELEVPGELLQAVIRHPGLRELDLAANLAMLEPELLAQAVTRLEEVGLGKLTSQQVSAICTAVTPNSQLRVLGLSCDNLSIVDAELLAQAVTHLEEVDIDQLTPQKVTAICTAITDNSQLKSWNLSYTDLSSIRTDLLAEAVTQLEEANLAYTDLTSEQVETIFAALDKPSQLRILQMSGNNLSSVDPEVLAQAVTQLVEVELNDTQLAPQQVEAILAALKTPGKLKELQIQDTHLSLEFNFSQD